MLSSSDLTKLAMSTILMFNGTNYKVWSDALRSFLRYNRLWFLIEGYGSTTNQLMPDMPRPTTSATPI